MITPEQIEAAHADLVLAGMAPESHRLAATALARWRAQHDNGDRCAVFLRAFDLSDAAIHRLMFPDAPR